MRRAFLIVLGSYLLLPFAARAQSITDCPSGNDIGSSRVVCTYGTYDNPYRDSTTGNTHVATIQSGLVRMGNTAVNTNGFGASATYLYRVDTSQIHILLIRCIVNINSIGAIPADTLSYASIQIIDSTGTPFGDSCHRVHFTYYDQHGTTATSGNNVNYSTSNRYYAFDMRPFHGETIGIKLLAAKPQGVNCRCMMRVAFLCIKLDTITTQYSCSQGYTHTAPEGFIYEWYPLGHPDSIVCTTRTFTLHDIGIYSCRLRSYASPNGGCSLSTLTTAPITFRESEGTMDVTPFDTIQFDTVCRVRFHLGSHFSTHTYTSAGDTFLIPNDPLVPHTWILDGNALSAADTLVTLSPGSHTLLLSYNRTPQCAVQLSQTLFVNRIACHYYDSLYSTCPSVHDLGGDRVSCTYGTWSTESITEYPGLIAGRHTLITTPVIDTPTNGMLSSIPPGESASIRLGNRSSGSEFESITFYYKVDTTQASLLILRYAAVLENPNHNVTQQPRFTFEINDSSGSPINSDCYSATYIASTSLGWTASPSYPNVLYKDWTTVGADLSGVHGQVVSIRLTTYDCTQGAHFGYAYFTLGCHQRQIQAVHCLDTSYYTAPEGFSYQWYPDGHPDSVVATTRNFATISRQQFHCRLGFIGAPAGTNCHTLISTSAPVPQYPVARFTLDTLDTLNCQLHLRLVNNSRIVTEYSADSITSVPCTTYTCLLDNQPVTPSAPDTLILPPLSSGAHSIRLIAHIDGMPCTDTAELLFTSNFLCQRLDTLYACTEAFPFSIEGNPVFGDTTLTLVHGDTIVLHTVVTLPRVDTTIADTIVQNQLPYLWHSIPFSLGTQASRLYPPTFDTSFFLPGNAPECDTLVHFSLLVYPNLFDTVYLYLCPGMIPHTLDTGIAIWGDTTILYLGSHGEDSTVTYFLFPLANTDTTILDTILERDLPWQFLDSLFTAESFPPTADTLRASFSLVNEQGCDSLIHYSLLILWDGDRCDTTLTFPTLVTPNADGVNDLFVIGGLLENNCFKFNDLLVYDRTGRLVYHGHNIASPSDWWDPAAQRAPDGTYFYIFRAHGVTIHTQHQGLIEILR